MQGTLHPKRTAAIMNMKYAAKLFAAIVLASGSASLQAQPTNLTLYNFDTDQVFDTGYGTAWGNWFGGGYVTVAWDPANDANNNAASGSMMLQLNWPPGDQYVLNDGINPGPNWGPFNIQTIWTNLSFDMRYDASSAIRTNAGGGNGSLGPGSLDFGYMRVGSRSPGFAQDWYNYFAVSATNGAGLPNTNWIHKDIDLRGVLSAFGDLSSGLVNIMFGMDGGAYGNAGLVGAQTIWFDNIKFTGYVAPIPPPTLSIREASPKGLWLFGGSGLYGRSQVALQDTGATWIGGNFPVSYSFTILDNATSPGALQTGIQFIGGGGDASYLDYGANNVLWLRIVSGTGTNTTCVADVSWKTNAPGSNPDQHNVALSITNPVLAGTWTLTFNSDTTGTLTAPGASPVPFALNLDPVEAAAAFSAPIQVRFGHENFGNTANGGVPHYWANILVTNAASGIAVYEDFTKEGTTQLDTNIWNLNTSDGVGVINLVPTNAPYWIRWTQPDSGFSLVSSTSLAEPRSTWNSLANVTPISQGGMTWALIPGASLPAGSGSFFALAKRTFTRLQVLLPGETNAPNTPTGKVGTPTPISVGAGLPIDITINAVDANYHIVTTAPGDTIDITSSDALAVLPLPAPLVNGTVTQQLYFGNTGNFTVTATDTTNNNIPPANSSSVTVGP
jgi:hypothetical protein